MNNEIKEILDYYRNIVNDKKETYTVISKDTIYLEQLLDYINKLEEEKDKYKMRCYNALKMIWDNYSVLDKYEIEMLEDILKGEDNE